MDIDKIRKRAQEIWEAEGKPEGQHERHWQLAEQELSGREEPPETAPSADRGATTIFGGRKKRKPHSAPSQGSEPGSIELGKSRRKTGTSRGLMTGKFATADGLFCDD